MPRPVHFEIHASDPERVKVFYEQLFGWSFQRWGDQPYWVIRTGEEAVGIDGGLVPRRGPTGAADAPVMAFVCTVQVSDTDAALAKAVALGGTVALPNSAVPGVGWLAYAKDPDGNIFGMMTPDPAAA